MMDTNTLSSGQFGDMAGSGSDSSSSDSSSSDSASSGTPSVGLSMPKAPAGF